MIILFQSSDQLRVVSNNWIYSYWMLNPYQIKKILNYIKRRAFGKAWKILKSYPFEKECVDAYLHKHENGSKA